MSVYYDHEERYRELRRQGARAWSSHGYKTNAAACLERFGLGAPSDTPSRVLELGCGAGAVCHRLTRLGHEVRGVDHSPTAIAMAREQGLEEDTRPPLFEVADVLTVELGDAGYDWVLSVHVLHCLKGEHRRQYLAQAKRALGPRGRVALVTMVGLPHAAELRALVDEDTRISSDGRRVFVEEDTVLSEIEEAGLGVERVERVADPAGCDELWVVTGAGDR